MRIGYQGEAGAFSEMAAQQRFPDAAHIPFRDFELAAQALAAGAIDYAVLPAENSIAGVVEGTRAILNRAGYMIVDELWLPIHHCVMAIADATLADLGHILSHPVALAQCTRFFGNHPGITPQPWYDTAGAALYVASNRDSTLGAIAPRGAALRYGLAVLAENVEDRDDNRTRFVVLGKGLASERSDR